MPPKQSAKRARSSPGGLVPSRAEVEEEAGGPVVTTSRAKRGAQPVVVVPHATPASDDDHGKPSEDRAVSRDGRLPLTYESRLWGMDPGALIVGVDEAGRGPLAGPVVASACVMLPPAAWPALFAAAAAGRGGGGGGSSTIPGVDAGSLLTGPWAPPVSRVTDSKAVEEEEREALFPILTSDPRLVFGTAVVDHATIDRVNILRATMLAMDSAVARAAHAARGALARAGLAPHVDTSASAAAPSAAIDEDDVRWSAPFGMAGAGRGGLDPHLRLHTVLVDGNKCPPGVTLACTGHTQHAAPTTPASSSSRARRPPITTPVVEDEAYATSVQRVGRAAMAMRADADVTAGPGAFEGGGGSSSSSTGAGCAPPAPTVGEVLTLAPVDAGAHAAHVLFRTTSSLAGSIGRVHTVQPVVGGDGKVYCIAAASLVAKVTRDRLMRAAGAAWPGYGLEVHKGYGTAAHMALIHKRGPCPIHRLTFAPLKTTYPDAAAAAKGTRGEEG